MGCHVCPHRITEFGDIGGEGAAFVATGDVAFGFARGIAGQFAVQKGLRAQEFGAVHTSSLAVHFSRSIVRARASRDITVPMGAPVISAISR